MRANNPYRYLNADAVPTASGDSSSATSIAGIAAQGLTMIAGLVLSQKNAQEQRKLQEKLALLSLQQKKELELSLYQVQGEVAKMELLYKALNMDKDRQALVQINKQKYIGVAVIGIGLVILSIVIYKAKKNGK